MTGGGAAVSAPASSSGAFARPLAPSFHFLFLHGYTTPHPDVSGWQTAFSTAGLTPASITTPVAKSGATRIDPFNPDGEPSWFRYATESTETVPQQPDRANFTDLYEAMYQASGNDSGRSLWEVLSTLVAFAGGAQNVVLAGESQGGLMAAFLGIEWNRQNPTNPLGRIGLISTIRIIQETTPRYQAADEEQGPRILDQLHKDIADLRNHRPRRRRQCPRAVRIKMTKSPLSRSRPRGRV